MSFKLTVNKKETVTGTSSWVKFPDLKWKFNDLLTSILSFYTSSCLETLSTWIFQYNLQLVVSQSKGFTMAPNYLPLLWFSFQSRALPHYPGQKTLALSQAPPFSFTCHFIEDRVWLGSLWLGFVFASLFSLPPPQFRSLSSHGWIPRKAHPTGLILF